MKKVIIVIIILVVGACTFLVFDNKNNTERCLIAYMDKDTQIQQTYKYDITYSGLFYKRVSNISATKKIISFRNDEEITNEYYDQYEEEGKLQKYFSQYNYELKLEKNINTTVLFKSNLKLKNKDSDALSYSEYNNLIDKNGNITLKGLKQYYKDQGALCKNIKKFQ